MKLLRSIIIVLISLQFGACASTKYTSSGHVYSLSPCHLSSENLSALVIWRPRWRPDQKDVSLRELAAQHGIEQYFTHSTCYETAIILRVDDSHDVPSEVETLHMARAHPSRPDRVIMMTVRELGPFLKLRLAPEFIMGGTEVVFDINIVNVMSGLSMTHFQAHWQNGGAFVIKGVSTLEQDMQSALESAFHESPDI